MQVYIPVKNKLEMTGRLLIELDRQDGHHPVTILDNGSTEDIFELCKQHQVEYLDCEGLNIHEMWNRAIKLNRGQPLALLNNDIRLHNDNVLDRMEQVLEEHPEVGVVSPYFGHRDHQAQLGLISVPAHPGANGGLAGFCFAMSGAISRWYQFPEQLEWWYGDVDLFCSSVDADKALCVIRDIRIEHLDGGSVTARDEDLGEVKEQDYLEFRRMWAKLFAEDES